jgi:hypothetical protein
MGGFVCLIWFLGCFLNFLPKASLNGDPPT